MTNPNQANINTFLFSSYSANLNTSYSDIIKNSLNSNAAIEVKSITFTNFSETTSASVSVRYFNVALNDYVFLNSKLDIAAKSSRQLLTKDISLNLIEGDFIQANTYTNNSNVGVLVGFNDTSERTNYTGMVASYPFSVNYLVVAGGGGGGQGTGGGGGAGGFLTSNVNVSSVQTWTVTVGGGGSVKISGSNSQIITSSTSFNAIGGGGAASNANGGAPYTASNGGSGGGGAEGSVGGLGTSGQGFDGGTGAPWPPYVSGGGGGAGGPGGKGSSGAGLYSSISGTSTGYAGGGGGGNFPSGGAPGGGGNADFGGGNVSTSGTANRGGGGGGSQGNGSSAGAGGSGIVIVSYPGLRRASGGNVTYAAGNTIHTFTGSGNLTFSAFCFFS